MALGLSTRGSLHSTWFKRQSLPTTVQKKKQLVQLIPPPRSYGLGAVVFQVQDDGTKKSVAYASRSMTPTEQRYAQIENETLAPTWACEKFADYILGKDFIIETDQKPLMPLLGSRCLLASNDFA